jgi:hypothetical protein
MRPLILLICMMASIGACKTTNYESQSEIKVAFASGPAGKTYVFFEDPASSRMIRGRSCPQKAEINTVSDIDKFCPFKGEDKRWSKETFKANFVELFFSTEMLEVAQASKFGGLRDHRQEFAENSEKEKAHYERMLRTFRGFLDRAERQRNWPEINLWRGRVTQFEAELRRVDEVGTLMQQIKKLVDAFIDTALSQTEVFPILLEDGPDELLLVKTVARMMDGPLFYCRGCASASKRTYFYGCREALTEELSRKLATDFCHTISDGVNKLPMDQQLCFTTSESRSIDQARSLCRYNRIE